MAVNTGIFRSAQIGKIEHVIGRSVQRKAEKVGIGGVAQKLTSIKTKVQLPVALEQFPILPLKGKFTEFARVLGINGPRRVVDYTVVHIGKSGVQDPIIRVGRQPKVTAGVTVENLEFCSKCDVEAENE